MVIAFANNQTLVCIGSTAVTVHTDPVPLSGSDRLTSTANVHSIATNSATGAPQFVYTAQLSNDGGQTWVDSAFVTDTLTSAGIAQDVGTVNAALVRLRFVFSNPLAVGTDVSTVCFDLHVKVDHV